MPGTPAARPTTTKTEFARYLNDHEDAVPALKDVLFEYRKTPHRMNNFGIWLRINKEAIFQRTYENWWLHNPKLFGAVYQESAGQ